ncbi:MAG TPA: hypothetical protein VK993_01640 [Chthoniobacterales bacterium]|nr:hypothetical protein [Chthoniobacterales bacterium]
MKHLLIRALQISALLIALAAPAVAQESNRGFFEGNARDGSKILFLVENNGSISAYVFNRGQRSGNVGAAAIDVNGSFTITFSNGETITGSVSGTRITATFRGSTFTADLSDFFGRGGELAGRFKGKARGKDGRNFDLKVLVNPAGKIFIMAKGNLGFFGGFGDMNIEPDDDDKSGDRDDDEDSDDDEDEFDNRERDGTRHNRKFKGTFTITLGDGASFTGSFKFQDGKFKAKIKIDGIDFDFDSFRDSEDHHLANISTRGFVNTGQGQLIGGFIVRGGPKLVLVRAIGPSLAARGVNPALANPRLQLFLQNKDGTSVAVAENDDWQSNRNAQDITRTSIPPQDARESALLIRLEPGAYTAVITGADSGTGVALVEVYEINRD